MSKNRIFNQVYSLNCPITGEIKYIGVTIKSLKDRLGIHLWGAKNRNRTIKDSWINGLTALGLSPKIRLIEEVEDTKLKYEREKYWIATLKASGANLVNSTIGGQGLVGYDYTEETRAKISKAHKGKIISEDAKNKQRAKMLGRRISEETKKKISIAGRGRTVTEEAKRKISEAKKGIPCEKTAGELNGRAVLTADKVKEIRESNYSLSKIVKIYGISKSQASRVKRGLQWK